MKIFRILTSIFIALLLCSFPVIFPQATDQSNQHRGVRLAGRDNQTGKEGFVNLYNKVYGVIIGIDLYENLPLGQKLRYAVRDSKGIEKMLRERFVFDEILTLYNSEATREAIMSILAGKLSQTAVDDAVFIFFAGHGYTDTTRYGELGYLVPYDGSVDKDKLYKNISMTQIKDEVSKQIRAKHVFFMVDACYSGLLVTRGKNAKSESTFRELDYLRQITKEAVRQVLTAGGKDEEVLDGGPYGHSVFVGRILQVLENTSDYITASELSVKVKEKVFSDAVGMGHIQTPAFGAFFGLGDFVFVPRADKQYEEIHAEVGILQSQLKEIEKQRQELEKIKSEREIREAARKEEDLKGQLKAKQLEEERLLKEKERKERLEQEEKRLAQEEAQEIAEKERQKAADEEKLRLLRQKLVEDEVTLKDIKQEVFSIDTARKEVEALETKIKSVVSLITQEKRKAFAQLEKDYDLLIKKLQDKPVPPKGQFETTTDYDARVKKHQDKFRDLKDQYGNECSEIQDKYYNEIKSRTRPYKAQIEELKTRKYPVEGLKIELYKYNADKELYHVVLRTPEKLFGYYWISLKPELARELFERKGLLKAEGYFESLYNTNLLSQAFLIDPISGSHQLISTGIKLRRDYLMLNETEVISMMIQMGFFDSRKNPSREFINQFESTRIKGDTVILDYATNLIWHKPEVTALSGYYCLTFNEAKSCIETLNEKGYASSHGWRLPTLDEASSLLKQVKNNKNSLHINPIFDYTEAIWTGDQENSEKGWILDFKKGQVSSIYYDLNKNDFNDYIDVFVVRSMNK